MSARDEQPAEATCPCCGGDPNTVCSACEQHSCWAGQMYCDEYRTAGVKRKQPAPAGDDELREADRQESFATEQARGMLHPRLVVCPARTHPSFLVDSDETVACPWCERGRELERLHVELVRAQALSSADPAAIAELRAENQRLRARAHDRQT